MLLEFSVANFRSFKDQTTLSMVASRLTSINPRIDIENVITVNKKLSVLRSAIIYGSNASGKSNLIKAFTFMRSFVNESARQQEQDLIPTEPFLLSTESLTEPSTFEVVFLMDDFVQYRYGFSVTPERVVAEWLYYTPTVREAVLFTRDSNGFNPPNSAFKEGNSIRNLVQENQLFLPLVAQYKRGGIASRVRDWFIHKTHSIRSVTDHRYLPFTLECIAEGKGNKANIEELVRKSDVGVIGLSVKEIPLSPEAETIQKLLSTGRDPDTQASVGIEQRDARLTRPKLHTRHEVKNSEGGVVSTVDFLADKMESDGTNKLIALAGPIIDVLSKGTILFVDEIDSRLHPAITAAIIGLFNSQSSNPKGAQLICVTHDTNLLDHQVFRRDQIYFVEKDGFDSSHICSLADYNAVRKDELFERNYLNGRYGAIPYVGKLVSMFDAPLQPALDGISSHR